MRQWQQRLLLVVLFVVGYLMLRTITTRLADQTSTWISDGVVGIICLVLLFKPSPKNRF